MKLQHGFAGLVFASVVMGAGVAAAGEPVERRLYSDAIDASSFLWGDWNRFVENYHPNYVGDDDPKTAWVEGVPGSGAGQWVRLQVTPLDGTTRVRLKIRNGYQKSKELFAANARAKDVVVRLLPSRAEVKATLTDSDGWQEVIVSQPVGALRAIELRVGSVYEGTKYQDLCISDVAVYASSTTADNPTFEKSKKKSLLAWRAGRIAAAKAWSSAGVALPLHASYQVTSTEGQVDCDNCDLAGMLAAAAADPAWKPWQEAIAVGQQTVAELDRLPTVQVAPRAKTALPVADGFERPDLGQVAGFEGPQTVATEVVRVLVHPGVAAVERVGATSITVGGALHLAALPVGLDDDSVQVGIVGPAEVRAVRVELAAVATVDAGAADAEVVAARAALAQRRAERDAVTQGLAALAALAPVEPRAELPTLPDWDAAVAARAALVELGRQRLAAGRERLAALAEELADAERATIAPWTCP
jgi:hypothetical protein